MHVSLNRFMKTTTSFRKSRGESVRLLKANTLLVFVENAALFRREGL